MKRPLFLLLLVFFIPSAYCQTLFTYGNHEVKAGEFLKAYNKNKTGPDNQQSLRDYLDLYINFKLKVQAAKDLRLDTLPALQADLHNFRNQIEENYLKDDKIVAALVDEAFSRSQKDIHVLYYFVPAVDDTLKSSKIANELYQQLKSNSNSDEEVLKKINGSGSLVQKNDFGFITVFTLPYNFENIVYGLKPGQYSAPFRTKKGWHIFKNLEEREAAGKIKIAQILFSVPEGFDAQRAQTKKLADSVWNALKNGGDFTMLAKEFSDDRSTFMNGGELPEFGVAKYSPLFEKTAFAMKSDNEISPVFESEFGYHILKRIAATPVPSDKNDENYATNLRQEVLQDNRINSAKEQFVKAILPKTGFKKLPVKESDLWNLTDSSLLGISISRIENITLFSFNNNRKINARDWIDYIKNIPQPETGNTHDFYKKSFNDYVDFSILENYRERLENFNADFKNQLDEFREGNMLFEVMERNIWGKAASDSAGLHEYYKSHQQKYKWEASATAVIFSCANEVVAKSCMEELEKGKSWKDVQSDYSSQVQADSARYEFAQIPLNEPVQLTPGMITQPVVNKTDGTVVFTKVLKVFPAHEQRNFEDARGLVINDYQSFLEEKWVKELKSKYPVRVNQKAFQALLK